MPVQAECVHALAQRSGHEIRHYLLNLQKRVIVGFPNFAGLLSHKNGIQSKSKFCPPPLNKPILTGKWGEK